MRLNRREEALLREMIREELNEISLSDVGDWVKSRLGKKKQPEEIPKSVNQRIQAFRDEIVKDVQVVEQELEDVKSASSSASSSDVSYALNSFVHVLNGLRKKLIQVMSQYSDETGNEPIVKQRLKMLSFRGQSGEEIVSKALESIAVMTKLVKDKKDDMKSLVSKITPQMLALTKLQQLAERGSLGVMNVSALQKKS